jgi:hypothetical protein
MKSGKPIHPSNGIGTAPDAAVTPAGTFISFDFGAGATTMFVVVTNMEAARALEISFANGRDKAWFAVAPGTTISMPVVCHNCRVRGASGGTAAYAIMGIVA